MIEDTRIRLGDPSGDCAQPARGADCGDAHACHCKGNHGVGQIETDPAVRSARAAVAQFAWDLGRCRRCGLRGCSILDLYEADSAMGHLASYFVDFIRPKLLRGGCARDHIEAFCDWRREFRQGPNGEGAISTVPGVEK